MRKEPLFYDGVVTICSTRYGGVYEHAAWMAFSGSCDEIDADRAFGSDPDCRDWWDDLRKNDMTYSWHAKTYSELVYVAIGKSPHEVYRNLLARNKSVGFVGSEYTGEHANE